MSKSRSHSQDPSAAQRLDSSPLLSISGPGLSKLASPIVAVAFFWGWSEATWFFLVPDIWLSFSVFWGPATALRSLLAATAGAMAGALTWYALPQPAQQFLADWWSHCPGYSQAMFPVARQHLSQGPSGLLPGPWIGIPYRFYLLQASQSGLSLLGLLLWTPVARLPRLLLSPLVVGSSWSLLCLAHRQGLIPRDPRPFALSLVLLSWIVIYIDYWFVFVPRHYP